MGVARGRGLIAGVGFVPAWRVDRASRLDPDDARWAAGRALRWSLEGVRVSVARTLLVAVRRGVGATPLRSWFVAGFSALVDGFGLRDCFRKRRLRPGTVGGRMAFTACGAGTGRTGRKPPRALNKDDSPPGGGGFPFVEMAGSDAQAWFR